MPLLKAISCSTLHLVHLLSSQLFSSQTVPTGQVWGGIPASHERDLNASEIEALQQLARNQVELGMKHRAEHAKTEAHRQKDRDQSELFKPEENLYKESPF